MNLIHLAQIHQDNMFDRYLQKNSTNIVARLLDGNSYDEVVPYDAVDAICLAQDFDMRLGQL